MRIIIEGAGEVGSHLAKLLSAESNEITVIDPYEERLDAIKAMADVVTIQGSLSSISDLKKANVQDADLFISVNPKVPQDVNIVSALLAKKLGCRKVTARIDDEEFLSSENKLMFKQMGLDLMFYPEKSAADEIVSLLRHNSSADTTEFGRGKLQLTVVRVDDESPLLDKRVVEVAHEMAEVLPDHKFRMVAISRDSQTLIPRFDTKFRFHDQVYLMGRRDDIPALNDYLGRVTSRIGSVMIMGGSDIGEMLARQLTGVVEEIKIIEKSKDRCLRLSEILDESITIVNGDARDAELLQDEDIRSFDAFVAVTDNDEANILACIGAKRYGVSRVIAEVENIEYLHLAEDMGVNAVINKKLITAGRIFKFTLSDKVRSVRYMSGTNAEVLEYTVAPGSPITRKPLRDLPFAEDAVIGGLIRGTEAFIAVGDTLIEPYDRVVVFALPDAVKEVDRFFK